MEDSPEVPVEKPKKTCNLHDDCARADEDAKKRGRLLGAAHCHDDCCEDCFGQ